MQLNRPRTEASVDLGAYWNDELPTAPYRIPPSIQAQLVRVLIVLSITLIGVCGMLAGFVAFALPD